MKKGGRHQSGKMHVKRPDRMTTQQRTARAKARKTILDTANKHRSKDLKSFGQRHIQQAVHHVRHHHLVKPDVLKKAGFNG